MKICLQILLFLATAFFQTARCQSASAEEEFMRKAAQLLFEVEGYDNKRFENFSEDVYPQVPNLQSLVCKHPNLTIPLLKSGKYYSIKLGLSLLAGTDSELDDRLAGYLLGVMAEDSDPDINGFVFHVEILSNVVDQLKRRSLTYPSFFTQLLLQSHL